jgi:hypothetical protein
LGEKQDGEVYNVYAAFATEENTNNRQATGAANLLTHITAPRTLPGSLFAVA